jgi:hypothetical protein
MHFAGGIRCNSLSAYHNMLIRCQVQSTGGHFIHECISHSTFCLWILVYFLQAMQSSFSKIKKPRRGGAYIKNFKAYDFTSTSPSMVSITGSAIFANFTVTLLVNLPGFSALYVTFIMPAFPF